MTRTRCPIGGARNAGVCAKRGSVRTVRSRRWERGDCCCQQRSTSSRPLPEDVTYHSQANDGGSAKATAPKLRGRRTVTRARRSCGGGIPSCSRENQPRLTPTEVALRGLEKLRLLRPLARDEASDYADIIAAVRERPDSSDILHFGGAPPLTRPPPPPGFPVTAAARSRSRKKAPTVNRLRSWSLTSSTPSQQTRTQPSAASTGKRVRPMKPYSPRPQSGATSRWVRDSARSYPQRCGARSKHRAPHQRRGLRPLLPTQEGANSPRRNGPKPRSGPCALQFRRLSCERLTTTGDHLLVRCRPVDPAAETQRRRALRCRRRDNVATCRHAAQPEGSATRQRTTRGL